MKKAINSKTYFQTLNIIYFAQVMLLLSFSAVVGLLINNNQTAGGEQAPWQYIVPVVLIISLAAGHFLFKYMVEKINNSLPLKEKMPKYTQAVLVRSALLEVPGLLAAIAAFLAGQIFYLAVPLTICLVFLMLRPTKSSIEQELKLSPKERAMLDNPNAIISEADQAK